MAHFLVYDTEAAPSAGGSFKGEPSLWPTLDSQAGTQHYGPIKNGKTWTSIPAQTDFAEFISGSVYSEKEGTLEVQQSFDYPIVHESEVESLEKAHWDIVEKVTVKDGESKGFYYFTVAPYFRLVWTQGASETKKLRIFARAQEKGRL